MSRTLKNSLAIVAGLLLFVAAVYVGYRTSVTNWAGPNPTAEFFQRTDMGRIYGPAFTGPFALSLLIYPVSVPVLAGIACAFYFGIRRGWWLLTFAGFALLSLYWYAMVLLAWDIR